MPIPARSCGAISKGSASSTAEVGQFAHLDAADEVIEFERISRPNVIACRASITGIRSWLPRIRPPAVTRLTAHHAVNNGPMGVMGASECNDMGTPGLQRGFRGIHPERPRGSQGVRVMRIPQK